MRQFSDPQLQRDADKSGMVHLRKGTSRTQFLEGYGTTNFGVSPFEEKPLLPASLPRWPFAVIGAAAAAVCLWKLKQQVRVFSDYALLVREAASP